MRCRLNTKINYMKTVKTFAAVLLLTGILSTGSFAQTEKKMELKEHKCTAACTKKKHVYAHGEKGHVCTDACKKMMDKKGGKM